MDEGLINNINRNFKGQQPNETVHSFCRKHWVVLVPYFMGLILMVGIIVISLFSPYLNYLKDFITAPIYNLLISIGIIGITYFHHYFFLRIFDYYLQTFIITNYRVVQLNQTLYFHDSRDSIDLQEIQDLEFNQDGIFKTIFNYGELTITISSGDAPKTFHHLPHPEYHFRKINKTKREYITVRRLQKGLPEEEVTV
ncbi:hypothetical protein HZA42_05050 [Candidatus Peregrinibacteria bacterium]|nr:hypothetical protein [Candidatus Peregrinibacteria bacterium]